MMEPIPRARATARVEKSFRNAKEVKKTLKHCTAQSPAVGYGGFALHPLGTTTLCAISQINKVGIGTVGTGPPPTHTHTHTCLLSRERPRLVHHVQLLPYSRPLAPPASQFARALPGTQPNHRLSCRRSVPVGVAPALACACIAASRVLAALLRRRRVSQAKARDDGAAVRAQRRRQAVTIAQVLGTAQAQAVLAAHQLHVGHLARGQVGPWSGGETPAAQLTGVVAPSHSWKRKTTLAGIFMEKGEHQRHSVL